jgi:hypothetical protein
MTLDVPIILDQSIVAHVSGTHFIYEERMMNAQRPQDQLADFLTNSQAVLGLIVEHAEVLLPRELNNDVIRSSMTAAWKEVRQRLNKMIATVRETDDLNALETEGLTGAQLRFKLAVFDQLFADYKDVRGQLKQRGFVLPKTPVWRWILRWMEKILKAINAILKSIIKALKLDGAVEEFKGILEAAIGAQDLAESQG